MGTLGTAWSAGGSARPRLPGGWGQVCSRLSRPGQGLTVAPGEEEDAEGGKGSFPAVVLAWGCTSWEPGGRLGRSLEDARQNQ